MVMTVCGLWLVACAEHFSPIISQLNTTVFLMSGILSSGGLFVLLFVGDAFGFISLNIF